MKEKISKLVNVYKKYGFIGFCKKLRAYIIANYLDKISFKTIFNKKKYTKEIEKILSDNKYDRIILWRSSFGYNVPLFQRPQHIANNLSKNNCLVFYEVTTMTDKVKIYKKFSNNLYLFNYNNKALNKILMNCLKDINKPKYIQLYSTDWKLSVENIENYIANGFKFIYEYIDHISPVLSGTKDLPKNISDKYEYILNHKKNVYVVVTADNLEKDIIEKRGKENLIFSSNGVDYNFFQTIDKDYKFESEFTKVLNKPCICYYGALASWFDYDLIKKINDTNKYNIVLFGIKYDESFDLSGINELKNVYFFGPRDYKVLKNYASKMDVMIIPFVLNEITSSTSPVKLFEYMAMKKPIVTTEKFIITVNPEIIMKSYKNIVIKEMLLNDNNILVPDGISIIKKAKQYNINIKERITGVDISSKALEICNKNKKSIYLFGSKKEVLDKLIININQKYPNINIVGFSDGNVEDKDKIMQEIISLSPDLILIALGVPNQELLINKYIEKAKKGVFIGVGGTFDVLSGCKKRAPKLFIKLNLEWLYRIICEPTRLKRFIQNNIVFIFKK